MLYQALRAATWWEESLTFKDRTFHVEILISKHIVDFSQNIVMMKMFAETYQLIKKRDNSLKIEYWKYWNIVYINTFNNVREK